jgi:hypothetical protein
LLSAGAVALTKEPQVLMRLSLELLTLTSTWSPLIGELPGPVTVTVTTEVLSGAVVFTKFGLAATAVWNVVGSAVWVTTTGLDAAPLAPSVAVIVQSPALDDDVYVASTTPVALLEPDAGAIVPQTPVLLNVTVSPETGPVVALVTVATRAEVAPLATSDVGVALSATDVPLTGLLAAVK